MTPFVNASRSASSRLSPQRRGARPGIKCPRPLMTPFIALMGCIIRRARAKPDRSGSADLSGFIPPPSTAGPRREKTGARDNARDMMERRCRIICFVLLCSAERPGYPGASSSSFPRCAIARQRKIEEANAIDYAGGAGIASARLGSSGRRGKKIRFYTTRSLVCVQVICYAERY